MPKTVEIDEPRNLPGFDTLAWSKYLQASGTPKKQADALVTMVAYAAGYIALPQDFLDNS